MKQGSPFLKVDSLKKKDISSSSAEKRPKKKELDDWTEVVKRPSNRGKVTQKILDTSLKSKFPEKKKGSNQPTRRRPPRTAAIQISCRGEVSYADVMKHAKEKIDIDAMGIEDIRPRKARTGALLLEIPGVEGVKKANNLAAKMRKVFGRYEDVLISRPEKIAEIRVRDLEESTTKEDIVKCIVDLTKCERDVIKVGEISFAFGGLGTTLIRCPVAVANAVVKDKKIRIGWMRSRVELLPERPLQCYKCLETGHIRAQCRSAIDYSEVCYRCGENGHPAKGCLQQVRCVLCAGRGLKANHRMGSQVCKPGIRKLPLGSNKVPLPPVRGKVERMETEVLDSSKLPEGESISLSGKVEEENAGKSLVNMSMDMEMEAMAEMCAQLSQPSGDGTRDTQPLESTVEWPTLGDKWHASGGDTGVAPEEQVGGTSTDTQPK
ncbi:hypothetical protein ALC62_06328 [Cyphomyrmex costatus]|uniref:CCHC-type domain-containing protein n=1 Tax=Cyphomyrmex costatus TaxID=456900 RepID=A0A151IJD4_9HYME|nr:hypothetical protein ALC62_06328 [Cyphomyrmex costatus]